MAALFELDDVSVVRGGTVVLDHVSVELPDSGVTAIVGASGSGKSTLLRLCNRLERPTGGCIRFRGRDVSTLDPLQHRARVAMVFQRPTVFPGTALENLRAGAPALDRAQAAALLEQVGLDPELLDREADRLSGGEAQRLCLARALATGPEVVLADEATSALDEASTLVLESLARALADGGTPVVWVTHDMAQVSRLADHVVEIERGRVTFAGPVAEFQRRVREVG
jgi:putative ABC transport system ATP-binding protein